MSHWSFLVDETALATVLPREYAHFLRPLVGGLLEFLDGLPEAHQEAILIDQAALPATATAAARLAVLARSCPALHKLGQILARDRRLSAELRMHLQALESLPPAVSFETIQDILARELGPLNQLGLTLLPPALAEASVAVVIPFQVNGGQRAEVPQEWVFKVLKPGIEERLEQELELFERVGSYLDQRCDDFGIPHLGYQEVFEQVRDKLRHEVRLDREQQHLAQARAFYHGQPQVQVPALSEHCTPRVTAMERVVGSKVTEHGLTAASARRRLAHLVVETLLAQPLFSRSNATLFHGDPHAGNLFFTREQRLAILDWSLVGSLGEGDRTALVQLLLAAVTLNAERVATILEGLARRPGIDQGALLQVVQGWLGRLRHGQFPGFHWLMGLLDEAVQTARLRVGDDLLLFRKTLYTLEGVVADIEEGDSHIEAVLLRAFLGHFVAEWPQRWLVLPQCREFATRLSNLDLCQLLLSWPWTAAQFLFDVVGQRGASCAVGQRSTLQGC